MAEGYHAAGEINVTTIISIIYSNRKETGVKLPGLKCLQGKLNLSKSIFNHSKMSHLSLRSAVHF